MALVRAQRIVLAPPPPVPVVRVGGTFESETDVDVSAGNFVIELRNPPFNAPGVWTLLTWTGTLTGTANDVTIENYSGFAAPLHPYLDGKAFKIVLT